jgi:hypothetical protein
MGIHKHYECSTSLWNFAQQLVQGQRYVVYIGMCNQGEAEGLQEVMPSLYGFAKEQDAINAQKLCWWVAPKLFFVYSESGITNSLR